MKTSYMTSGQKANRILRPPKYLLPRGWFRKRRMPGYLADAPICLTFGASEAQFIRALDYWLKRSQNVHDNRLWSYNTLSAWSSYSGLKSGALRRVINDLQKRKILLTWRPNRRKPTWYSLDYAKLRQIVVANLKENGDWPYPECDRFDHTESDRTDHTQKLESDRIRQTRLTESDGFDHTIQEPNKNQETPLNQETQSEQQQTDPVVVINNSRKASNTDQPDTLSVEARRKSDFIGDKLRATGREQTSAGLEAIFQRYLTEFGTEVPDNIKVKMRSAELLTCQNALNATLERKKDGTLTNPPGFLWKAVQKKWKPVDTPDRGSTLGKLLKELDWSGFLKDKEWPDRPDEAIFVSDLNESEQQAYEDFLHQQIQIRNQQTAGLIEEIRNEWRRIGYDSGPNELVEQSWRTHQFKGLADVPREEDVARAYLSNLQKRPDKEDTQTTTSAPPDLTPQIPEPQSALPPNKHSDSKPVLDENVYMRGGMSSLKKILLTSGNKTQAE